MENNKNNPLSELISDDVYEVLDSRGLINKKVCQRLYDKKTV